MLEKGKENKRFKKGLGTKINASPAKRYFWRRVLMPKMAKQEMLGGSQKRRPSEGLVLSRSPRGTGGFVLLGESANHIRVPGGKAAA